MPYCALFHRPVESLSKLLFNTDFRNKGSQSSPLSESGIGSGPSAFLLGKRSLAHQHLKLVEYSWEYRCDCV